MSDVSTLVDDYQPAGLDTDWHSAVFDGATVEQFIAYNEVCEGWASVAMPTLGLGLGAAWIVEVSQEHGLFERPNGSTTGQAGPGHNVMQLVIEIDGYTHS